MQARLGPLRVEITQGENERFTSPMLFVHGLWDTFESWRGVTGFLAHRGWHCVAVQLRDRAAFDDHAGDLAAVVGALGLPPVLVGHDLGALLALARASEARAVVALAPLLTRPFAENAAPVLRRAGNLLSRWRGRPLSAPRGRWRRVYHAAARNRREPANLIRELCEEELPIAVAPDVPSLVVVGTEDPVAAPPGAKRLADAIGADFASVPGGHALPVETGWQDCAATIHRWVVQRLGTSLLELYEEEGAE